MHRLKGCEFKYMADNQYNISLGVTVDTSDIKAQISNVKTEPIKIDFDLNHTKKQVDAIRSQIQTLNNVNVNLGSRTSTGSKSGVKNAVNDMNWAYRQMLDIQKKANSLSLKINGLDASKNVNELKELSAQFNRLRADYETLKSAFGGQLSNIQLGNLQAELDETTAKLSAMDAKLADTKAELAKDIRFKLGDDGKFATQVTKIKSDANKLSVVSDELSVDLKELDAAMGAMDFASKTNDVDGLINSYRHFENVLERVENQLKQNKIANQDAASSIKLEDDRNIFQSNIDSWLTKNSAAAKKFGAQMIELKAQAKSCDQVTLNHLKNEFKRLDKEADKAGLKMQTFGDRIKTQFSKYSQYFSVASIFMYATMGLRDMFDQVVAIDTAMTELKKVTDETDESYNKFLSNAATRSKEIGTTIDGLVSSTADFARLGYGFEDSQGLAEVANIYAVVGDEIDGVEGATQSLVSTMAAFKDEMNGMSDSDFAMSIVDKFNEVSNNFSISSGGIGDALQRSASSMAAANNTLDETIALITAANTVVQDPDAVGRLMPTLKMAISVKLQRWTRPRKDFISIFLIHIN